MRNGTRRGGTRRPTPEPKIAYIGLGANLGARRATIRRALEMLRERGVRPVKVSRLVETKPVGGARGQPMFLNGAAEVATVLGPRKLLSVLLDVERALGRDRKPGVRNAPRPIDLDLLLYGSRVIRTPDLTVPHPRMHRRMFVLGPLSEIAPRAIHPVLGRTIAQLAARFGDLR